MAITYPATGGAWRTVANPFGGSPLVEFKSDGTGDGTEARAYGIAQANMTEADGLAFQLALALWNGETLDQAKAPLVVFQPPLKVVQTASGPVALESLDQTNQEYYNSINAANAKKAADAMSILQTGKWQGTGMDAGSFVLHDPGLPPPAPQPPALVTTISDPPGSMPVVGHETLVQLNKVAPVLRIDTIPESPTDTTPVYTAGDALNTGVTTAPPTTPVVASSVTGGVAGATAVTSSALPAAENNAATSGGSGSQPAGSKVTLVVGILVVIAIAVALLGGGASSSSSGGAE